MKLMALIVLVALTALGFAKAQVHGGPAHAGSLTCGPALPTLPALPPPPEGCTPEDAEAIQEGYETACREVQDGLCEEIHGEGGYRDQWLACKAAADVALGACLSDPNKTAAECNLAWENARAQCNSTYQAHKDILGGIWVSAVDDLADHWSQEMAECGGE